MTHIVLLGDSVFDNKAYVGTGPEVVEQLRRVLPTPARASLLAIDGTLISHVSGQVLRRPDDATHLVISTGGNDALRASGVIEARATYVADALSRLAEIQDRFRSDYRAMLDDAGRARLPLAVCTIYEPRFPDPFRRKLAATALSVLNDVITREAFSRGLPVLDLRSICGEDADFANPIEPSTIGGAKIATAITRLLPLWATGPNASVVISR